ncbi:helix-turn-helix domain-containing protein [Thermomonospora cellulosilytica]|uniref:Transcriptional regulator with XRE-family HTH domain n=1 Tax=Thermomonospora cellulosilytica TaxID=1411118 RepID=A0A7W3MUE5_9ACTN|nr:helix-turn-helix domain-containing protein [Thermomonospora cellulosilytica]MBA9002108.1 transcriptional regulator with XRE-family HTH domain [Thermomonospora cellulosilytica]
MTTAESRRAIGARLKAERERRGWGQRTLARLLREAVDDPQKPDHESFVTYVKRWEAGKVDRISDRYRAAYAAVLGIPERELFTPQPTVQPPADTAGDDELEALELARRVAASDLGEATLQALEHAADDLACAYQGTPPDALLQRVRKHLAYVGMLMDARKTLAEHRRLLVVGGWLCLLAATCDVDLHRRSAARARLRTAAQLAQHAEHPEIMAWCLETEAWQALTDGDYRKAIDLSRAAQQVAPKTGSAYIQATAQEGRAHARLGSGPETRDALTRVDRLVASLQMPDRPEHHFRYDPAKRDSYTVTALSWIGDPAAESQAREVLTNLESPTNGPRRPRRAATARLDLALALASTGRPDEAAHTALQAVTSGRLVPSTYWRAEEIITAVQDHGTPEAADLIEAYRELRRPLTS